MPDLETTIDLDEIEDIPVVVFYSVDPYDPGYCLAPPQGGGIEIEEVQGQYTGVDYLPHMSAAQVALLEGTVLRAIAR